MSNQEILDFVKTINYACLFINPLGRQKCGPGEEKWKRDLEVLSAGQRLILETRIQRFKQRQEKEAIV